jgi:cell division GTPase FtsZ
MTKILGIGGAGGLNMVNLVIDSGFESENVVYIDTSRNGVCAARTDNFLEIGANMFKGYGSGKNQNGARVAA